MVHTCCIYKEIRIYKRIFIDIHTFLIDKTPKMTAGLAPGGIGSDGSPEDRGLGAKELVGAITDSKEGGLGGIGEVRGAN
jgi:hypothetical protein